MTTTDLTARQIRAKTEDFLSRTGSVSDLPATAEKNGAVAILVRRHLRVELVQRGRVVCVLTVHPEIVNIYDTLHGGAVTTVAEEVARACARTVADGGKELFLGEAQASYLASARVHAQVQVAASIVRRGRSVVVASVEFLSKDSGKLLYIYRATFYNVPISTL